jgi:hypothetical protein
LAGCAGSVQGFGTVRTATVAIGETDEGEFAVIGLLEKSPAACQDDSPPVGGGPPCSFLLEVLAMGGDEYWGSASDFDVLSFWFESVADEADLWGRESTHVNVAACYGPGTVDDTAAEPLDATVTLPEIEPPGTSIRIQLEGEVSGSLQAELCRD